MPDVALKPIRATVGVAAQLFGVTEKTVRSWIRGGLGVLKEGGKGSGNGAIVDLAVLVPWYLAENALDVAKTRLASAQADRHEMDNAIRRGEVAELGAIADVVANANAAVRAKLLSLPTKLGAQLVNIADANILAGRIRAEIFAALAELANYSVEIPADDARMAIDRHAGLPAATVLNGERVGRRKASVKQRSQRRAGTMAN